MLILNKTHPRHILAFPETISCSETLSDSQKTPSHGPGTFLGFCSLIKQCLKKRFRVVWPMLPRFSSLSECTTRTFLKYIWYQTPPTNFQNLSRQLGRGGGVDDILAYAIFTWMDNPPRNIRSKCWGWEQKRQDLRCSIKLSCWSLVCAGVSRAVAAHCWHSSRFCATRAHKVHQTMSLLSYQDELRKNALLNYNQFHVIGSKIANLCVYLRHFLCSCRIVYLSLHETTKRSKVCVWPIKKRHAEELYQRHDGVLECVRLRALSAVLLDTTTQSMTLPIRCIY